MKLHLCEYNPREQSLRLFTESLFNELINANDKISRWEDYVDDYDSNRPRKSYSNDTTLLDVKNDLLDMIQSLDSDLQSIPKVRSVKFKSSSHVGLSNYIEIKFEKPRDDKYLKYYGSEYMLNIRLSDHIPQGGYASSVTNNLDIVGRTFNDVKEDILNIARTQSNKLSQFESNWKKKCKPSSTRKNQHKASAKNNKNRYKNESYTKALMKTYVEPYVEQYLESVDVAVEYIIPELNHRVDFEDLNYRQIVDIVVHCLNTNIIDYTFDDFMNWELLANDVQELVHSKHSEQLMTI